MTLYPKLFPNTDLDAWIEGCEALQSVWTLSTTELPNPELKIWCCFYLSNFLCLESQVQGRSLDSTSNIPLIMVGGTVYKKCEWLKQIYCRNWVNGIIFHSSCSINKIRYTKSFQSLMCTHPWIESYKLLTRCFKSLCL
jgi:hypothetical protein